MRRLRPFFGYYGSKWILAPHYPAPLHRRVVEPFAGSACYSLLHWRREVTLVDAYPPIAGIWRYLISVSADEILALPDLAEGQTVADLNVCQEARWLIGLWIRSAQARPGLTSSPWARDKATRGICGFWGRPARERIARQLPCIRHWRVIEGSYRDAPQQEAATYFVDPPYVVGGSHYSAQPGDYQQLGGWCRELPGQVIVCEAEGAAWLPFTPLRTVRTAASGGRVGQSREVVWTG